jgi:hypothetical protein
MSTKGKDVKLPTDDTAADSKEIANAVVWLLSGTNDTWYLMGE